MVLEARSSSCCIFDSSHVAHVTYDSRHDGVRTINHCLGVTEQQQGVTIMQAGSAQRKRRCLLAAAAHVEGHAHHLQAQVCCSLEQLLSLCRVTAVLEAQGAASLRDSSKHRGSES